MMIPTAIASEPLDEHGLPVTYTTAWSSEIHPEIRPEPLLEPFMGVAPLALFGSGSRYDGIPLGRYPEAGRARRSVLLGLCQVCGQELPEGERWLCDLRIGAQVFRHHQLVPLVVDSWTCEVCLPYALLTCPNLTTRPALDAFRVRRWLPVPTSERPKNLPVSVPFGPVGFVKIAVLDATRYTRQQIIGHREKAPDSSG